MERRKIEKILAILCGVLCAVSLLTGCGKKTEEPVEKPPVSGPEDPAGQEGPETPDRTPADPALPETPGEQDPVGPADPADPEDPAEPETPEDDIPWPDRAESAAALQELVPKGELSPELIRAFSDYFNYGSGGELDYLPEFDENGAVPWDELTYYIANLAYRDGVALDGLTKDSFSRCVDRYLGNIAYEHHPSSFLFFDGETYTPTGWDSNGGHWYRLAELQDRGDGTYRAVLDALTFNEGDWPEDGEAGVNGQVVLDRYPETHGDYALWRAKLLELLLREDYREIFTVDDQLTITFQLFGAGNPFTYLSCHWASGESLRPGIVFPEQEGWMKAIRESLPEISEIVRQDGPEPDPVYLPPEHIWDILRIDEWSFVDQYTCEHYLGMGVPEVLIFYSGEEQVLRVMEYEAYGEQRTLLIIDAPIPAEAEDARIEGMIRISAPGECYMDLLDALGEPVGTAP